jgi:bifunctional non-homologous end joining protein LigD
VKLFCIRGTARTFRGKDLLYVARVRNGFVPATRSMVYQKLEPLVIEKCPFVNLPETGRARWGEILDAEKMKKCVGVRPKLVTYRQKSGRVH